MKVIVCVKICGSEINPFDEAALELALSMSDDVTVLSMGPKSAEDALKPLTRLGCKTVLISDKIYAGSDTLATAYILSQAVKKLKFDIIICGRQSIDGDTAQVGPMLAQNLGISLVTNVIELKTEENSITAVTRGGTADVKIPVLMTAERCRTLRFPSIFSKQGNVEVWNNEKIGCIPERCGINGSPTRVLETFENKSGRRHCKFISFDELFPLIESIKKMSDTDKNEVKKDERPRAKFKNVWAVGQKAAEAAENIAQSVTVLEEIPPERVAAAAAEKKPEVILWNADAWGRKNAPIAAAILKTGLCADCTSLETDGETLYMYRPARSGSVTAKIKCLTKPQMATVRTESDSADIIVSGGRGVYNKLTELTGFAKEIGAELCASRGLVDMGAVPYDRQVGLTGKNVAPKIYIAVGISGAVHHTCAIEQSKVIIAVNPDRNARIFDYADYGIVKKF